MVLGRPNHAKSMRTCLEFYSRLREVVYGIGRNVTAMPTEPDALDREQVATTRAARVSEFVRPGEVMRVSG
jgi:hypothetical protein